MKEMVFTYDGITAEVDEDALHEARRQFEEQVEEAEHLEETRDGIPFCGCSDCFCRIESGFWISWTIKAIRDKVLVPVYAAS